MSFIDTIRTKPWMPEQGGSPSQPQFDQSSGFSLPKETVGLRVFLMVATSLFLLFIVSYRLRMNYEDWRPLAEPWQLWLNTGLLLLSSVALQWARVAAGKGNMPGVRMGMQVGGMLTIAFFAGQAWAWQHLNSLGYFIRENPANSFFYLITAVHGLHLVGGLVAWWRTSSKIRRGADVADIRLSIELCSVYWHYLLVVWFVLFYLLLAT